MSEKMKERLFELALITVALVGLLILFTVMFKGPRIIFNKTVNYLNVGS